MTKMLLQVLDWHQAATILYLLSVYSVSLILFLRGFLELRRYCSIDRGQEFGGAREHSSLLPEIAVLMPAYNEGNVHFGECASDAQASLSAI